MPDPGLNDTEEVTVSFASPQDMEEGVSQSPAESPKPKPVPRPRRGLHSQPNIEGSAEMDVNKEDMAKEEEEEVESEGRDAVSAVEDSPSQSLSSRTNIQSLDSLDNVTDIDGAQDSPVPRPRLGHVITSHSRPGSVQSRDRSSVQSNERPSVEKFSADQSSITSEDRSKSDSSSADNVPALELTRALVSAYLHTNRCRQQFLIRIASCPPSPLLSPSLPSPPLLFLLCGTFYRNNSSSSTPPRRMKKTIPQGQQDLSRSPHLL